MVIENIIDEYNESIVNDGTKFMYFAYGSNLLGDRIRIQNPSAVRCSNGVLKVSEWNYYVFIMSFSIRCDLLFLVMQNKNNCFSSFIIHLFIWAVLLSLKGFRLDFFQSAHRSKSYWNGSAATITEDSETEVWGTIWEIDICHLRELDRLVEHFFFSFFFFFFNF